MTNAFIDFVLEEPTGVERWAWPVSRGVPFPAGVLARPTNLRLLDQAGHEVPLQVRALGAPWPDGSLRWVLLHFQADLPAQGKAHYRLEYGTGVQQAPVAAGVAVRQAGAHWVLETGPLRVTLATGAGFGLAAQAWLNGQPMLASHDPLGFELRTPAGGHFTSAWGRLEAITVEETGPLRAVVRVEGDHRSATGGRLFGYVARLYAYAGQPWLEIEYTFVNDAAPDYTELSEIGLRLAPQVDVGWRVLCGAYAEQHEVEEGGLTLLGLPGSTSVFSGLKIYDAAGQHIEYENPGEMSRRVAHGWIDLSDANGGVAAIVRRAVQMAPKALRGGAEGLAIDLWPREAGPLRWHQGMARTQRLLLHFHAGRGSETAVAQVATCYEQDLQLWAPDWYVASGVAGPVLPYQPTRYPHIEMALRDQYALWHATNRALGFRDYGDHIQHGGGARAQYMANNEADLTQCLALQYMRVGEEGYAEDMEATAWHLMDVDIVHFTTHDPLELRGARIHGDDHVQYNCEGMQNISVAASHMWTEGLLNYYYLSGHPRALECALGIGECLLGLIDAGWPLPPYKVIWHSVRDTGWPLIALTALYEATREERWLAACRRLVAALLEVGQQAGGWGLQLGWHRSLSPLHLGIVITGLSRYHRLTGDEAARTAIVKAADQMLTVCRHPDGALMYVDAPGWRRNYSSGVAYESLGYVWELTGEPRYLEAGWVAHRRCLHSSGLGMVTGTALADWWRGLLRYLAWADQAGLLTDLSL